jgi:cation diffusion facilitator CzcD-associated flavoprotein CzcO
VIDDGFDVAMSDQTLHAKNVVLAVGLHQFARIPRELTDLLPDGRWLHTRDLVDFSAAAGRRYVIVGGRQSAFEWAALLVEAGATSVDVVHRHPSPAFATADWAWAGQLAQRLTTDPAWFRRLEHGEQQAITRRMWGEGRLKVEPWLAARLAHPAVRIRPSRSVTAATEDNDGLLLTLDDGDRLRADVVVLATGYVPDVQRLPFLCEGNVLEHLAVHHGCPQLDPGFQTSIPGLFATGPLATADFGPFFGFTLPARSAAAVLGHAVRGRMASRPAAPAAGRRSGC